jgi:hypothetical protein
MKLSPALILLLAVTACSAPRPAHSIAGGNPAADSHDSGYTYSSSSSDDPGDSDPAKGLVVLDGAASGWRASLVYDNDPTGIWRMEPLQFFPQYATPEVIGLDDHGTCWIMVSYSGKWTPTPVLHDGTWLGAVAFEDLDPSATGKELYLGGKKGVLYQVRAYADGGMDGRRIAKLAGREIHTLVAGELDPRNPGPELLVFTRPGGLDRLWLGADGTFQTVHLADLPGRIRDALLLPDGHSIVTASRTGAVSILQITENGPQWQPIHQTDEGRGRLALGKIGANGIPVIYSSGDNGRIFRHQAQADGSWATSTIYSGPLGPRGLVSGQFDPDPSIETVAVFGYSGRVELLSKRDGQWNSKTIFSDRDRGHWLSKLEIDRRNNTDEIMLSGYGARMVLLSMDPGSGVPELAVPPKLDRHAHR